MAKSESLLLAQKAGLSPETRSRWVAAGLVHLLAISGMHVGLIAGGVIVLANPQALQVFGDQAKAQEGK